MHMADGNKAGVMDLLANHAQCHHNGLPRRVNVWGFAQEREGRLKGRCQALRRRGGQPQTVRTAGIDESSHYSYSPSLLRAESGTDTPQSIAAPNSLRSQSSWGSTG